MTQVTEDSSVQIRNPVANRADFDSHKFKGTFGWATDQVAPVFCPADDADFVRLSVHPDEAPDAGTLNPGDTILISVGGVLKKTTVTAIGGGGTWQPLDQDLTDIAALTTQAFGRSLLTQANAAAVRTLIGAPAVADLTGYQPLNGGLTAISALTTTAFGRSLLTQADAAAVRTLIGAGTSSFNGAYTSLSVIPAAIAALDDLAPAADRLPYFTNGTTAALATFSAFARTLLDDADAATARATLGAGTVSSVSMTVPTGFSVSGSPITGSGTLAMTLASQTADKVLASPSGSSGVPAFITLSASHIPSLPWSKITTGLPTTLTGYGITDAQPLGADLTAIEALATTGFLQRTGPDTWTLVAAPTPAAHEASHRAGGSDQLALTTILGGRITDVPQFAGLTLTGDTVVNQDTNWAANSTDGNDQSALSLCGGRTASATRGSFVTVRGNERPTSGGTLTLAAGDGIQGNVEFATSALVRMTLRKNGELDISSGALRVGSINGFGFMVAGLMRAAVVGDFPTLNQNTTGSAATLTTGRTIGITGDATWTSPSFNGSANVTAAITLATVNSNVGTFGSSSDAVSFTVDAKGRITGTMQTPMTPAWGFISGKPSTFAPSSHGPSHHATGSDPITGSEIAGLLPTSVPTFAGQSLKTVSNLADISYQHTDGTRRFFLRWDNVNDRWEASTAADDGSPRSARLTIPRADATPVSVALGLNLSSGAMQVGGVEIVSSSRGGTFATMRVTGLTAGLVKSNASGTLSNATANTDYLPVNNPASTGILDFDRTRSRISTISSSTPVVISSLKKFINATYAGTVTIDLPTPDAVDAGVEWKLQCLGATAITFRVVTNGTLMHIGSDPGTTAYPFQLYWMTEAGGTKTFTPSSQVNRCADIWCDGFYWYVRW